MVSKHIGNGRGGTGLLAYLLHDAVSADARHPATSDRVAWTATSGSPSDDVRLTMRIMQGLVADAPILKRRSGCSLGGRRATKPYAHLVLSWPADQRPDREQQVVAVKSALRSQGLEDHLAILVAHDDKAHHHVHVIGCRVHPETGRTNAMSYSGVKLSAWAEKYEREHGGIVIPTRVERSHQRTEFGAAVDRLMRDFKPPADLSPDRPGPGARRRTKGGRHESARERPASARPDTAASRARARPPFLAGRAPGMAGLSRHPGRHQPHGRTRRARGTARAARRRAGQAGRTGGRPGPREGAERPSTAESEPRRQLGSINELGRHPARTASSTRRTELVDCSPG